MREKEEKAVEKSDSSVVIPPRSEKQETGEQRPAKTFTYHGYHFIPVGFCADKGTAAGERRIRMMEWTAEPLYSVSDGYYSKKSFLEFADSEADVYYCVEHGCYYMPGDRKLFEYKGKFQWLQEGQEQTRSNKKGMKQSEESLQTRNQGQEKETAQVLSRKRWN